MIKTLLIFFWVILDNPSFGQVFSAAKLLSMLSETVHKKEDMLLSRKYIFSGSEISGDTTFKVYKTRPARKNKKIQTDSTGRKFIIAVLKETSTLTYQTTAAAEYTAIIDALKKDGFYCDYEKDSTINPDTYLYQHGYYTADAYIKKDEERTWYSVTFFKKIFSLTNTVQTAEDLLEFTSHEHLVNYFGENNVKKDLYYFAQNDVVKCSVLFINTKRQVIFIWKDGLNRRRINNLLFGGQQNLKSQQTSEEIIAENTWMLKSGLRIGMPLLELRVLNAKAICFAGGNSPNPGLVLPESSGKIDFENADVILVCNNCTDDKFLLLKKMYSDKALEEDRILFVLTIILYSRVTGRFE